YHVLLYYEVTPSDITSAATHFLGCYTDPQVVQIVLWYLDSGCSKHMTRDRSRLRNFVKKEFIGTVRFGNDHFGAIMGYGVYVIGDSILKLPSKSTHASSET
ncbi:hypothetical protein Tco_0357771, partial [Tanacetum coccineum]